VQQQLQRSLASSSNIPIGSSLHLATALTSHKASHTNLYLKSSLFVQQTDGCRLQLAAGYSKRRSKKQLNAAVRTHNGSHYSFRYSIN
jgi:hypothetical protein